MLIVGEVLPGLLSADNTALLSLDESGIKKGLDVLVEWYRDWRMKINEQVRNHACEAKKMARTDVQYIRY